MSAPKLLCPVCHSDNITPCENKSRSGQVLTHVCCVCGAMWDEEKRSQRLRAFEALELAP